MTAKKKLLTFKELASRLNGVQIPIFGVQWVPTEPECVFRRSRAGIPIDAGPPFRSMPGRL